MEAINWTSEHWADILAVISGVITLASIVAKLTPTPTDDAWVSKVVKIIDMLALNTSRVPKE